MDFSPDRGGGRASPTFTDETGRSSGGYHHGGADVEELDELLTFANDQRDVVLFAIDARVNMFDVFESFSQQELRGQHAAMQHQQQQQNQHRAAQEERSDVGGGGVSVGGGGGGGGSLHSGYAFARAASALHPTPLSGTASTPSLFSSQHHHQQAKTTTTTPTTKHVDSNFLYAVRCALQFYQDKAITSDKDFIGLMLFGTGKECNSFHFPNIFTLQEFDNPSAARVQELEVLIAAGDTSSKFYGDFSTYIGHMDAGNERQKQQQQKEEEKKKQPLLAFSDVLWAAQHMFHHIGSKKKVGYKRLFVFTSDMDPSLGGGALERERCFARARDLHQSGVAIEIFHLAPKTAMPTTTASGAQQPQQQQRARGSTTTATAATTTTTSSGGGSSGGPTASSSSSVFSHNSTLHGRDEQQQQQQFLLPPLVLSGIGASSDSSNAASGSLFSSVGGGTAVAGGTKKQQQDLLLLTAERQVTTLDATFWGQLLRTAASKRRSSHNFFGFGEGDGENSSSSSGVHVTPRLSGPDHKQQQQGDGAGDATPFSSSYASLTYENESAGEYVGTLHTANLRPRTTTTTTATTTASSVAPPPQTHHPFDSLLTQVKIKTFPQRKTGVFALRIGLDDASPTLNVALYPTNIRCPKPGYVRRHAATNRVVFSENRVVAKDTGDEVPSSEVKMKAKLKEANVQFSQDEVKKMKNPCLLPTGLQIVAFRSLQWLLPKLSIAKPAWIALDTTTPPQSSSSASATATASGTATTAPAGDLAASKKLFKHLYETMRQRELYALAQYVRTSSTGSTVRFVALIPSGVGCGSNELECEPTVRGVGFHLFPLPYGGEIFSMKKFADVVPGDAGATVDAAAVAKAKKMIRKLGVDFNPSDIDNPALQRQYYLLQQLALMNPISDDGNANSGGPPDNAMPDTDGMQRLQKYFDDFKKGAYEGWYNPETAASAPRAAKPPPSATDMATIDFEELEDRDELSTLTIPYLKEFLKTNGVDAGKGKKAELVEKVRQHIQSKKVVKRERE